MKVVILLCLLAAGAQAEECTGSGLDYFFCTIANAAETVGKQLLDTVEQAALTTATQLGGQLVGGLQTIAHAATATDPPALVGKRSIDMATVLKVAGFVEQHRQLVSDLGHTLQNVTNVTLTKIDGLLKDFTHNPNEQVLSNIVAYVKAHHLIQDGIDDWIDKNVSPLPAFALKELLATQFHKRDVADLMTQAEDFGSQLAGSFGPLGNLLKTLVDTVGEQVLTAAPGLLSNPQLQVLPHLSGVVGAVEQAAGDILGEALKQSAPSVNGLLTDVQRALATLLSQQ